MQKKTLRDDAVPPFQVLIDLRDYLAWPNRLRRRLPPVVDARGPAHPRQARGGRNDAGAERGPGVLGRELVRAEPTTCTASCSGHPDLRRLLTDYIQGFRCARISRSRATSRCATTTRRSVVYEPVRLTQEFRNFDFESPWEGVDYVLPGDEKAAINPPRARPDAHEGHAEARRQDQVLLSRSGRQDGAAPLPGGGRVRDDADGIRHRLHGRPHGVDVHEGAGAAPGSRRGQPRRQDQRQPRRRDGAGPDGDGRSRVQRRPGAGAPPSTSARTTAST